MRREVILTIGEADENYRLGPCWELDYNIRAARAGFRSVWACGAFVHRSPFSTRRWLEESLRFEVNKQRYQDKYCALRLRGERTTYAFHCLGEDCEHFAPPESIQIVLREECKESPSQVFPVHKESKENAPRTTLLKEELTIIRSISSTPIFEKEEHSNVHTWPTILTSSTSDMPLVSCIMPTRNRRAFIKQALAYFEREDYPNRELIIVDDGDDQVYNLLPPDPRVRYIALNRQISIGAKRNIACEQARGAIIAHWDDDDWYAPHRLGYQVAPLLDNIADMTGLVSGCLFDLTNWQSWVCTPELHRRIFAGDVHGGTLLYWRRLWEHLAHYPPLSLAEDALFLRQVCQLGARLHKLPNANSFVYIRHSSNAWKFPLGTYLQPAGWERTNVNLFLPPTDLPFYRALSQDSTSTRVPPVSFTRLLPYHMISGEEKGVPLVSCIMPTYNRRTFIKQSISYFFRQDYTNKELIIVDDGTDAVSDLIPVDECVRYIRLKERITVGAKRNLACEQARGSIIVHWDDDDWHAPYQLRYQVGSILREGTDLCGTCTLLFYDLVNQRAWQYIYPKGREQRMWLSGNTLCYRRSFWANNRFVNMNVGEDARFVWGSRRNRLTMLEDVTFLVGMIHEQNVSPKKTDGFFWKPYPVEEIRLLVGNDWAFYQHYMVLMKIPQKHT